MYDDQPESDRALLIALQGAAHDGDARALAQMIVEYYSDVDRADRTPRSIVYLHLGFCARFLGDPAPEQNL